MIKPDMLPIIEAHLTQWDCGESEYTREFLAGVILRAEIERAPIDIDLAFELPCQELAGRALDCLVKTTGYSPDWFESLSDCQHMKFSSFGFHLPKYVCSLLDVRSSCLLVLGHIEEARQFDPDSHAECAVEEVRELIKRLESLEMAVAERHFLQKDLHSTVEAEQAVRSEIAQKYRQKMETARAGRTALHDWAAVAKLEAELLATGKSRREFANIIERRLKIPKSTYREWRRKQTTG
ncbi:hypothetical protein PMI29_03022 [Pseudomonas sp. GM49]|uniref:hypothetical protein n=1 Tax=Pseudomonas sp. GM49 TaxID=1144331 RepID=UPI00026FD395|nr:hypothetical protein [Pseudomonas sp. GM49]EJM64586.1 hypothetical protein PMI29_03022 [Pseudomonas sp. GM49]